MKYLKYFEKSGGVTITYQDFTSLKSFNISKHIDGDFDCSNNKLTSLEFGPETVDGSFYCFKNKLTSLEFCPKYICGMFLCSSNQLTSLEFCPKKVGHFTCANNQLSSLKHGPEFVDGNFICDNNRLTSLDFLPEYISGVIYCNKNDWTNPIPYKLIEKYNIDKKTLYMDFQLEKFGEYEYQKAFLTETPEKYRDLEPIGFNEDILEEFDWLFNAADMRLM